MLTPDEQSVLEKLKRGRRTPVRVAECAEIVLLAAVGLENQEIGEAMGISRQKAGRWRDRYAQAGLAGIEKGVPRSGRHRRIDEKQRAEVIRKTQQEAPEGHTHWRSRGLSP